MTTRKSTRNGDRRRSHHWVLVVGLLAITAGCPAVDDGAAGSDGPPPAELAQTASSSQDPSGVDDATPAPRPPAGHAWVIFAEDTVVAEVAATAEARQQGLMYRDEVPDGTGMLFVFQDNQPRAFWMANTYVPLDIAYMDPSYRIVDIVQMEPLVTETYPSDAPAMFALEVRKGWFGEEGIEVGAQAEIVFGVGGSR
jgi:uncharacterized membrane protein (UPF0127 family)